MEGVKEAGIKMIYVRTIFTFSHREHTCVSLQETLPKIKILPKKFYISRIKA